MYVYEEHRAFIFTEDGQVLFLRVRDRIAKLLATSGAFDLHSAVSGISGGNDWQKIACVDRLVELKELHEIKNPYSSAGQDRIFIKVGR